MDPPALVPLHLGRGSHTTLIPASAKQKGVQFNTSCVTQDKRLKSSRHTTKVGPIKKLKRYNPYDMRNATPDDLDESSLLDTPIEQAPGDGSWAWVASPQQPPGASRVFMPLLLLV